MITAEDTFYYSVLSLHGVEEWLDVPGYELKYQVSNLGRVRTKDYEIKDHWGNGHTRTRRFQSHILKPTMGNLHRRYSVKLSDENQVRRTFAVEQIVALAFLGQRPEGWHTCHNDGSRDNNCLYNLRYDTPKGNAQDTQRHGRFSKPLTLDQVLEIEDMYDSGMWQADIAECFGYTQPGISAILRGKYYA